MITVADLKLARELGRNFGEHLRLQFREMTKKARHAARSMMFGQSICGHYEWKSRVTRRGELILTTWEPILRRIGVARVEFIRHRWLQRFVMRGKWSVL